MSRRSLLVLLTGDPVPTVHQEIGDFAALIRAGVGASWNGEWSVVDARVELPASLDWAGVFISGSPESLTQPSAWMEPALNYVRSLVTSDVPTLGICFGHQMLGAALGGRVENNPNGREIGTVDLTLHQPDTLVETSFGEAVDESFKVNMTHLDSVVRLPPGARVVASTALEPHALVQFAPRAWGVQFHPEIDQRVMRAYVDHRRDQLAQEGLDSSLIHSLAQDTPLSAGLMKTFAQLFALRTQQP